MSSILLFLITMPAYSIDSFLSLGGSYSFYSTEGMREFSSRLDGAGYKLGIGFVSKKAIYKFYFGSGDRAGTLKNDGASYSLSQSYTEVGGEVSLLFSKRLYVDLGFTYTNFEYDLGSISEYRKTVLESIYGVEDVNLPSILFGIGYNLYVGKNNSLFVNYEYRIYSEESASSHGFILGYRQRIKL